MAIERNMQTVKVRGTGRRLNLILWAAFSLFAIVMLALYAIVQGLLMDRQYRERLVNNLREAGEEVSELLDGERSYTRSEIERELFRLSYSNHVATNLYYEDGQVVFPDLTQAPLPQTELDTLKEQLQNGGKYCVFSVGNSVVYGRTATVEGENCYVYMTSSIAPILQIERGHGTLSLISALFAVVLSFVASGFIAMLITKPVSEVTARAKALARGNYDFTFKENYFCAEINELSEALDYARAEISKADKMQKELIANVSHDFKTPLTMIKAYASMIREISGENKEKRDANAQVIIDEADRLAALVGDVLDLSRIQAGAGKGNETVFNLAEEVYRIVGRFDYLVETQGYRFQTEIEDGRYTRANRERIEQVLYNLIGNAVNYTGEDKLVRVRLFEKEGATRFEVIDSGKGIAQEELKTIWDRYYRSSKTGKRPAKGTGLGLSIVKNILTAHQFLFGVTSQEGKGSCFWVEFPAPPNEVSYKK